MRASRTLARAIATEVAAYTLLGFAAFLLVLTLQNLAQRLDELVAVGFEARDLLGVVAWLLPVVAAYAVPVGFLFGILVTVGRLSSDSEITAMRACGLGLGALLAPVVAMGVAVSALTAWLIVCVEPDARLALRGVLRDVASRGALLEPGSFKNVAGRVVYVRSRDRDNRLEGVLVADRSDPERPFLIFAESGRFVFDRERSVIHLELARGDLHLEPLGEDRDSHRRIAFEHLDYAIDANPILDAVRDPKPRELDMSQLRERIEQAQAGTLPADVRRRDPGEYRVQYHRRLALPAAPLLFALVGVPLGLRRARGARSWGAFACVLLVSAYYLLLSLGQFLGASGRVPAAAALWLPNAAFAVAAGVLLRRAERGEA